MLAGFSARVWAVLAGIGTALAVVAGAFLRGRQAGMDSARARAAEQAQRQATERANADRDAGRAADPAGELRRDWSR